MFYTYVLFIYLFMYLFKLQSIDLLFSLFFIFVKKVLHNSHPVELAEVILESFSPSGKKWMIIRKKTISEKPSLLLEVTYYFFQTFIIMKYFYFLIIPTF